jgi:serine/threonine protein kinase
MEEHSRDEAVLLARLHHPGLVTVYDFGRHDGRAYLVMQLVEGETLRARSAAGPMAPRRVTDLGAQLSRTLAHVHAAGIMHRDVKPSNVILDAGGRPYLTDFGISRPVDATGNTAPGALIGTAAYLSPEQVMGRRVEQPADVYALGLTLLECLTGRIEYGGGPLQAAVARLRRPPNIPPGLPEVLESLLRDMTAVEPAHRPEAWRCADLLAVARDDLVAEAAAAAARGGPGREGGAPRAARRARQDDRSVLPALLPGQRVRPAIEATVRRWPWLPAV